MTDYVLCAPSFPKFQRVTPIVPFLFSSIVNISSIPTRDNPLNILNSSTRSCLFLRSSRVPSLKYFVIEYEKTIPYSPALFPRIWHIWRPQLRWDKLWSLCLTTRWQHDTDLFWAFWWIRMILLQTVAKWWCVKLCAILFSGPICRNKITWYSNNNPKPNYDPNPNSKPNHR